jgi:hypothetical protein
MATSTNNVLTYGLSGKIGDLLIFRQKDGKTIVAKVPEQSKTASEKQKEQRKRFQQATCGSMPPPSPMKVWTATALSSLPPTCPETSPPNSGAYSYLTAKIQLRNKS